MQITADTVNQNYKESVKRLLSSKNAYSFMSSVKGTPVYWKQFLFEVLAMVKQIGIRTYFLTLSCADLRWNELPYIINKLNNLCLSDEELENLCYQERTKLLNENSVLVARHFQYKVQVFFKELILDNLQVKQSIMLYAYNFKKEEAHMYILLFRYLMYQQLKINLHI